MVDNYEIWDYCVICDEMNNPEETMIKGEFNISVALKISEKTEFLHIEMKVSKD